MSNLPVAESAGKWGTSWYFPSGPDEGEWDTRQEAVRFIADMLEESNASMHILLGHSWFPDPEDFVEGVLDQIEERFYEDTNIDGGDPYLTDHITTSEDAFREDLEAVLLDVFRRHLKPASYWTEDSVLSGDGAREEIEEARL